MQKKTVDLEENVEEVNCIALKLYSIVFLQEKYSADIATIEVKQESHLKNAYSRPRAPLAFRWSYKTPS